MSQELFRAGVRDTLNKIARYGVPSVNAYGGRMSRKRSRGGLYRLPLRSYGMGRKKSRRSRSRGGSRKRSRRSRSRSMGGSRKRSRRSRSRSMGGSRRRSRKSRGGSRRRSRRSRGAGPISDILSTFGLGMTGGRRRKSRKGRGMTGGRRRKSRHSRGAGPLSGLLGAFGLGLTGGRRRKRSRRGGAIDMDEIQDLTENKQNYGNSNLIDLLRLSSANNNQTALKDSIDLLKLNGDTTANQTKYKSDASIYNINREAIRNQLSSGNYAVSAR